MQRIFTKLSVLFLTTVLFFSCKKNDLQPEVSTNVAPRSVSNEDGRITLGKKLENPYSVTNMKKAYSSLANSGTFVQGNAAVVTTTDYYVRFLPKDWSEYDVLKKDTVLKLYDIPLDYEVETPGWMYHDPPIPADKPTWQYTVVPVSYSFPDSIEHEILEELYLPEHDTKLTAGTGTRGNAIVALTNEAMHLTKNDQDSIKIAARTEGFYPQGKIQVFDTRLGRLIPLEGVKVRARRWFTIEEVVTTANGDFFILHSFSNPVNYALYYERDAFDVRSGTLGQAWWDGPKTEGRWDLNIMDGVQRFYANVFRGATRYHYGSIGVLKRPNVWDKLKYAAYDKSNDAQGVNWFNVTAGGIIPDIKIWRYNNDGVEYASDEIFSTTVHETAHGSHIELMNAGEIQYAQVERKIQESWAIGVEWFIAQLEYREKGIVNYSSQTYEVIASYPIRRAYQYWNRNRSGDYTSLFIDLVDNYNQRSEYLSTSVLSPDDNVTGYTLPQIEGFLKHVYGLSSLSTELKSHKPIGVTDAQIDLLLSFY